MKGGPQRARDWPAIRERNEPEIVTLPFVPSGNPDPA